MTSSSATWSFTSYRPGTSPWGTTTATLTPLLKFTCSQAEGESRQGQYVKHTCSSLVYNHYIGSQKAEYMVFTKSPAVRGSHQYRCWWQWQPCHRESVFCVKTRVVIVYNTLIVILFYSLRKSFNVRLGSRRKRKCRRTKPASFQCPCYPMMSVLVQGLHCAVIIPASIFSTNQ